MKIISHSVSTRALLICLFFLQVNNCLLAQGNVRPLLSNLQISTDWAQKTALLTYDLWDPDDNAVQVDLYLSNDNGKSYTLTSSITSTGAVGANIVPGWGKTISCDLTGIANVNGFYTIRLVADDLHPMSIQELVDQIDGDRICNDLHVLEGVRHRVTGAAHLTETRDGLFQHFLVYGLTPATDEFLQGTYTGINILGYQAGTSKAGKLIINDAHYDTVSNSPGADDNGSGVAGMMEVSRILSAYPTRKSVRYIGFDMEEDGLKGSIAYLADAAFLNDSIEGVFNFEMIGYYSEEPNSQELPAGFNLLFPDAVATMQANQFRGDFITNVGNASLSVPLMNLYFNAAAQYIPDLKVINLATPNNIGIASDLWRSDHGAFWAKSKSALMLTDGSEFRNNCYHTPNDSLDNKLDCNFMGKVVKATIASMADLAEIQHGDWKRVTFQNTSGTNEFANCSWQVTAPLGTEYISIALGNCNTAPEQVEVFTASGVLVQSFSFSDLSEGYWTAPVESGVYFVRLTNGLIQKVYKINRI